MTLVEAHDIVLYRGSHRAVSASSFTIPHGKITAVIGPNGSGKTTLLQSIAGILTPSAGRITVLGQAVKNVKQDISFVMQSVVFPTGTPITVKDVVSMGRYAQRGWFGMFRPHDRAAISYAMETMNITDLKHRHLEELSGGQRQRVYVAQGIAQGHEILVLDEPMTGLDLKSMRIIDDVIHAEVEEHGHSVILTTHDLDEAAAADHVILMDGKVIAAGPPEEVLTRKNLEKAYGLGTLHEPADVNGTTVVELPECTSEGDAAVAEEQPVGYGDRFRRYEAY
ncbi:MAG TPA: ABC transporter ATP-binding protein [Candidatus Yaniella excrementavium]|nr:ABC transporter ATP-binding protein [Candidatus Yaniella excrementavium]